MKGKSITPHIVEEKNNDMNEYRVIEVKDRRGYAWYIPQKKARIIHGKISVKVGLTKRLQWIGLEEISRRKLYG